MTVSEHVYTATVGAFEFGQVSGSIRLDSGRAPHVSGEITAAVPGVWSVDPIAHPLDNPGVYGDDVYGGGAFGGGRSINVPVWTPAPEVLEALDPRQSPPPRVTVTASKDGGTPRTFDLHVRDRSIDHKNGRVTLSLASDEALLQDYAPLADDAAPYAYQSSLRGVINYALNAAIPGAVLAASPATDADVTVYTATVNTVPDPRITNLANYPVTSATRVADTTFPGAQRGVTHTGAHLHTPTSSDSFIEFGGGSGALRLGMTGGKTYTISASGSVRTPLSGTRHARALRIVAFYRVGSGAYVEVASPALPTTVRTGTNGTRVSVDVALPVGATEAFVRLYHGYTGGSVTWGLPRVSEKVAPGPHNVDYFWGGAPATTEHSYVWERTADASPSRRVLLIDAPAADSLWWRSGTSALDFLHPLVQAKGLRLVCDERRVWTLRDENYNAPGALALRSGVTLTSADETISRDAGLWFDARVTRYRWTDSAGVQQERTDAYALAIPYTRLTTVDVDAAYVGPGRSEYAVRRAQGMGREVAVSTVSDWTAAAEQPVSVMLPDVPAQIGLTQAITFDLDTDEMTVTTRTTDTPAGAINLLAGTVNALTGTVNAL